MNVAFLGLGTMGLSMARNIQTAGHRVTVWNRTPRQIPFAADVAATPSAACRDSEVVITMLADPAAVEAVAFGPNGYLSALPRSAIAIDMSTVDPGLARRLAASADARGAHFLDAPVSGSRKPAEEAKLLILVGGESAILERARPVLECMGRVKHVGALGQGMAMKLVLNGVGAHMMTGFTSLMVLGAKLGLKPRDMLEVVTGGAFSSPAFVAKAPRIASGDFSPDFTIALWLKDQELVLQAAREVGYPMPVAETIYQVFAEAIREGFGELDLSGIVRLFEKWGGVTLRH